jgi:NAD(P)-dependent dehydrogenase (short-subunit alcohol dehydrogenase family)
MPSTSKFSTTEASTALIVGASRGLGLGLAREYLTRGWNVVATVRGEARTALHELAQEAGDRLRIEQLEVTDPDQIQALRERLSGRTLDLLFVNAGISNGPADTIGAASTEAFMRVMVTNALSPMHIVEALQEQVPPTGTIVVMSSGLGSVAGNERGGWEVYRASKAALNMLMRSFAARHATDPRCFVIMDPGWVRTDMGGPDAALDIKTSVSGMVDTLAAQSGRNGLRYLDYQGKVVPW